MGAQVSSPDEMTSVLPQAGKFSAAGGKKSNKYSFSVKGSLHKG